MKLCKALMTLDRRCFALTILLVAMDIQPGGCIQISSSTSQKEQQLNLTCTVQHQKEVKGLVIFVCKNRSKDCSPETSVKQLKLEMAPRTDGANETTSQLVFTINPVTLSNSGTYQCGARSQEPDIWLQGHFISISVTEKGNYTVMGPKPKQHHEPSHSEGVPSSHFLQKMWVLLVTSLVTLQGMSSRVLSTYLKCDTFVTLVILQEKENRKPRV
ncbi:PREDICTED: CD160 antigen [Chrysochloris asiatica]|uniref:CD160 antigen n=1 Tax=Chrysochloris asiatica TaxID=185453 RepID=A0A9B0TA47_CHRAS|nr:PREDICTED: CD160 antigen [Chrysochloris asiatica]